MKKISHSISRREILQGLAATVGLAAVGRVGAAKLASSYPDRQVRLVVPFPPGGAADNIARSLSQALQEKYGIVMVVENRPGASGTIGATHVAKSAPDGHTLLLSSSSVLCMAPHIYPQIQYDTMRDFEPVSPIATSPLVFIANPKLPVKSLPELMDLAKKDSTPIFYGSSGSGSLTHLTGELLSRASGSKMTHVPFKGAAPVLVAVMSGEIQVGITQVAEMRPHWQSGTVKALAVTGTSASPALPGVTTAKEQGVNGLDIATTWYGVLAPAGTRADIIDELNAMFAFALQNPQLRDVFGTQGIELGSSSPQDFKRYVKQETTDWAKAIKDVGFKLD